MGTMDDRRDDASLLAAWAGSRDQDAFRELCRRHAGLVAATCRRLGAPDADEAAQATFVVLVRKASGMDGGRLAGWLVLTARRVVADQRRAAERRRRHEQEAAMERHRPEAAEPVWDEARVQIGRASCRERVS
jgi:DNA-directed RNA polymerase specialized sigma24 family protein